MNVMSYKKADIAGYEYNKIYQSVYYFKNRDRLLAHARRQITCSKCDMKMPYSSYSYHLKGHQKKPKKKFLETETGKFILTFD